MNASFNRLVEKYMPNTEIVYDRYHGFRFRQTGRSQKASGQSPRIQKTG
ncbi:MAG: hypothetical protein II847_09195 [Ruminobacter sp.]|nr:hypothetical protein [Ruminobacter sp.]